MCRSLDKIMHAALRKSVTVVADPRDARIVELEAFTKSIRHASVLFSDGYTSEGIAQVNASLKHLRRHALPIAEVT